MLANVMYIVYFIIVSSNDIMNKKPISTDPAIKKTFNRFCESTSAHGFSHLKNINGGTNKLIFWHIVIVVAFVFLTFHLYTLIDKYFAYDYDETTTLVFESPVFPDITLCNMDPINSFTK